eukprot:826770-Pelagomonas_calceolata.AAC.8
MDAVGWGIGSAVVSCGGTGGPNKFRGNEHSGTNGSKENKLHELRQSLLVSGPAFQCDTGRLSFLGDLADTDMVRILLYQRCKQMPIPVHCKLWGTIAVTNYLSVSGRPEACKV